MKHKKLTSILSVLTLSAALLLTGCGGGTSDSGKESESTTSKIAVGEESTVPENVTSAPEEKTGSLNAIAGDNTEAEVDCSFTLEGKEYTLPFDYSQLEADGWTTDTDLNQELTGYTYTFIYIKKDGKDEHLTIDLYNGTGNNKKLKDCKVAEVEVTQKQTQSYSFAMGNGLKPGDDQNTITTTMSGSNDTQDYDDYTSITYGKSRDTGRIVFTLYKKAEDIANGNNMIRIEYFQQEKSISSNEVPAYLSGYKAPTAMGDDFDSATFTLDGVIYKLPCPTSEFVKNGWTVTKNADVPAGRVSSGTIEKNGVEIDVNFSNFAEYQTSGENSAISQIEISAFGDDDPIPDLLLPKNIDMTMKKDALETALAGSSVKFEKNESDSSNSFSYSDYDHGTEAYFYYNLENDRINSLKIAGRKWPSE